MYIYIYIYFLFSQENRNDAQHPNIAFGPASYFMGLEWCTNTCPLDYYLACTLPVFLLAVVTTLVFLYPCACCSCPALQLGALRPEDPLTELVIITEGGQERLVEVGRRSGQEMGKEVLATSNRAPEEEAISTQQANGAEGRLNLRPRADSAVRRVSSSKLSLSDESTRLCHS